MKCRTLKMVSIIDVGVSPLKMWPKPWGFKYLALNPKSSEVFRQPVPSGTDCYWNLFYASRTHKYFQKGLVKGSIAANGASACLNFNVIISLGGEKKFKKRFLLKKSHSVLPYLFMALIEKWISVQPYSIYLITHIIVVGCSPQIRGFGLLTEEWLG